MLCIFNLFLRTTKYPSDIYSERPPCYTLVSLVTYVHSWKAIILNGMPVADSELVTSLA
jgi:hypothetical protein